jgi:hypothetical protein
MSKIQIKSNHQLQQTPIVIPLLTPGGKEMENPFVGHNGDIKQTSLYGVRVPLIKINDVVVDALDVLYMELDGTGMLPRLNITVRDSRGTIKGLNNPSVDNNEIRVQILPRMENAYKKIDLTFYITQTDADDDIMNFTGVYKVMDLYKNRIKCFGQVSSYEMFEQLAHECKLGFASNITASNDKRYVYAPNISYLSLMQQAIGYSGDSGNSIQSKILYDCWIDFWNNVNFADIYERFDSVDDDKDMMIYISRYKQPLSQNTMDEETYMYTPATLSNHPIYMDTELFIDSYSNTNNSSLLSTGSDKVITIYNIDGGEALDYLLEDGKQKKTLNTVAQYIGENYEDFNYLLAKECREYMFSKMLDETIEVDVHSPLLQMMRGSKVNLRWYDTNIHLARIKQSLNIKDDDITTNIDTEPHPTNDTNPNARFRVDKQVTGQYYILGNIITFADGEWNNHLRLTRPKDQKFKYLDLSEISKLIK